MQWADEAAALYAMCQLQTKSLVTLKISEILFKNPSRNGDILEFWTRNKKIGTTSLTVECVVTRKKIGGKRQTSSSDATGAHTAAPIVKRLKQPTIDLSNPADIILSCELVFVSLDENGKPTPHGLKADE